MAKLPNPNKLNINADAMLAYDEAIRRFSEKLLSAADFIARKRNGNSIETGDLEQANENLDFNGRRTQFLLLVAGVTLGAGVSGLCQSSLDQKPILYFAAFGGLTFVGFIAAVIALKR